MALVSLPTELLHRIALDTVIYGYQGFRYTSYLRNLGRCCRYMNTIVIPCLYRELQLGPNNLFLLIRTILERPDIGLEVEDAFISSFDDSEDQKTCHANLDEAQNMLATTGLLPKPITHDIRQLEDPQGINLLLVELLLLQTLRIRKFSIDVQLFAPTAVLFDRERWEPGSPYLPTELWSRLHRLDVCSLRPHESRDIISQTQNLIAIAKPHSLRIYQDIPTKDYRQIYFHPQYPLLTQKYFSNFQCQQLSFPSVKQLLFWGRAMTRSVLADVLQCCPNVIDLDYESDAQPTVPGVLSRDICELLQPQSSTLERLRMRWLGNITNDEDFEASQPQLTDLHRFSALRKLTVEAYILNNVQIRKPSSRPIDLENGWIDGQPEEHSADTAKQSMHRKASFLDLLPSSLEQLDIVDEDGRNLEELGTLTDRKMRDFPRLKTIILDCIVPIVSDEVDRLRATLKPVGIDLIRCV